MFTNRFLNLLVAMSLLAVVVLVVREARATTSLVAEMDSATRSYLAWAEAAEAEENTLDSATRSYMALAEAAACDADATYSLDLDSATRSYIAWAKALVVGTSCR